MSLSACSHCCFGLSVLGAIFLSIIGFLFTTQPIYTSHEIAEEDPTAAAAACYTGALIYVGFIALSALGIYLDKRKQKQAAQSAREGLEEAEGLLTDHRNGYGTN